MFKSRLLTLMLLGSITVVAMLLPVSSAFAACSDCHWLFVRCMSRADTPEKKQSCEEGRVTCEETFCPDPARAGSNDLLRAVAVTPVSPPVEEAEANASQTQPAVQ